MSWPAIWAIVRKDVASVGRNRGVWIPLLLTPLVILVVIPIVLVGSAEAIASAGVIPDDIGTGSTFERLREIELQAGAVTEVPPAARWTVFVLEVFLAPLYLLVPLLVATVIAADSFAGERERGTLEALLHTPTTDRDLMAAKFLAAWLPAVTVAWVSFAVYSVVANLLAWSQVGWLFFPSPTWLLLALWVAPAVSALGLGFMVIASSRVKSLQGAHQVGSLVVIPVVVLFAMQITGFVFIGVRFVIAMGFGMWLLAALALVLGGGSLQRQRLAERI